MSNKKKIIILGGLITYDEVALAGAKWLAANSNYYLYTNQTYWLLSPSIFTGNSAYVGIVYTYGYLHYTAVATNFGVRPALSLKRGTEILRGDGTPQKPYIVTE